MKNEIEELSNKCLENAGNYTKYSGIDMVNATLIFQEVFAPLLFDKTRGTSKKYSSYRAEKAGRDLRMYILRYTGYDMHKVLKDQYKKDGTTR